MTFTNVNSAEISAIGSVLAELLWDEIEPTKQRNEEIDRAIEKILYFSGITGPHFPLPVTMHMADKMVLGDMGLFRAANGY